MDRLAALLERVLTPEDRPAARQPYQFPAPSFDGTGDVELFIQQFGEVAAANEWTEAATLLHLKGSLKGEAYQTTRYPTLQEVFQALRGRYTMTPREARATLARLRKDPQTPLQLHAVEVERLVAVAHAELPAQYRQGMVIDLFCTSLGYPALQRHLLAVALPTLDAAVQAGNAYLQVQTGPSNYNRPATRMLVEETELELHKESSSTPSQAAGPHADLLVAIQELSNQVSRLAATSTPATETVAKPAPRTPKPQAWGGATKHNSGNGRGPQ